MPRRKRQKLLMPHATLSDVGKRRAFQFRINLLHGILLVLLLIIVARLIELQIIRGRGYEEQAHAQHFGGIELPAKRGEILSKSSKTDETNILATNTTLDLLYVDPFVTKDKHHVAEVLSSMLLTEEFDAFCRSGDQKCPREFRTYYESAFDPVTRGSQENVENSSISSHPDIIRQFTNDIDRRVSEEFVSFVPLLYGADKIQLKKVSEFGIPGIYILENQKMVYANPQHIPDFERHRIARILSPVLKTDVSSIREKLRRRRLRYVPIMRKLPPDMSKAIKKKKEESARVAAEERSIFINEGQKEAADAVQDLLRGIALIPEHWRFYPDGTVAAQVIGFVREPPPGLSLTMKQQPQNGIERVFDHELRGQHGEISTVIDPFGGQIFSEDQTITQARDGRSVVLTIDRFLQKKVETVLQRAIEELEADSGQVIIMDPHTGRITVMANAPLFDSNNYSIVYEKKPFDIAPSEEPSIVVEIYHPQTNDLVIRGYLNDLTPEGRARLGRELQQELSALEKYFVLDDLKRYYFYLGENNRIELFPACPEGVSPAKSKPHLADEGNEVDEGEGAVITGCTWLAYKNRIGVGAYVNRALQEIYEPGSVFKPVTMSIAIDQGELTPDDMYFDEGSVEIDEYVIENAEGRVFDEVTMTDCLSYSVNTCMTHVSFKLGKKLFANYIKRFGFGKITGVQLEDEKTGKVLDWRRWSDALLATAAYGQGISSTPMQMVTAFASLGNGGKLVKPTIIESWVDSDGTEHPVHPQVLEQVITEEAAATVTAMLVRGMNEGFAKRAKVEGYRMAGKTGTSQIARPGGGYEETGSGTSITSFAGYAPVDHPAFVMLVKFDRPRTVEYGSMTAAPVFKEIAAILFEYYGIPPDEG